MWSVLVFHECLKNSAIRWCVYRCQMAPGTTLPQLSQTSSHPFRCSDWSSAPWEAFSLSTVPPGRAREGLSCWDHPPLGAVSASCKTTHEPRLSLFPCELATGKSLWSRRWAWVNRDESLLQTLLFMCPEVKLLDRTSPSVSFFWETIRVFPTVVAPVYISTSKALGFHFSAPPSCLIIFWFGS